MLLLWKTLKQRIAIFLLSQVFVFLLSPMVVLVIRMVRLLDLCLEPCLCDVIKKNTRQCTTGPIVVWRGEGESPWPDAKSPAGSRPWPEMLFWFGRARERVVALSSSTCPCLRCLRPLRRAVQMGRRRRRRRRKSHSLPRRRLFPALASSGRQPSSPPA